MSSDVNTIFAQWHGMPSRTLVQDPTGKIILLTPEQFVGLSDSMIFAKDQGYEKVKSTDKNGKENFKAGKKIAGRLSRRLPAAGIWFF
ncbi:hypothetical protein KRR40_38110 [Niabella defluvii]|nr:hypothetical protein KRR40_38110 [Niabella sp. I65]